MREGGYTPTVDFASGCPHLGTLPQPPGRLILKGRVDFSLHSDGSCWGPGQAPSCAQ